jgi:hypothetical protein
MKYPVLITVYTRFNNLKNLIGSLRLNSEASQTDLYVVSDAAKYVKDEKQIETIREYVKNDVIGFASVTLFAWDYNKGGAQSSLDAEELVIRKHKGYIYLEDDNIVSPYFLKYMNENLDRYETDPNVFCICAWNHLHSKIRDYSYENFFYCAMAAYGCGFWKNKYEKFIAEYQVPERGELIFERFRKHNVWAYDFLITDKREGTKTGDAAASYYMFKNNMVALFPMKPIVKNVGIGDGIGEHCGRNQVKEQDFYTGDEIFVNPPDCTIFPEIDKSIKAFFSYTPFQKVYYFLYRRGIVIPDRIRQGTIALLASLKKGNCYKDDAMHR